MRPAPPSPTTHTTSNQISQLEQPSSPSNQSQQTEENNLPSLHLDADSPHTYKGSQVASRITPFSAILPHPFHALAFIHTLRCPPPRDPPFLHSS